MILLTEYHAVKSVFDGGNPLEVDEIAIAVRSCFAGLSSDGFDFIQGLVLGFHLNEVKISSLHSNDFIKPTERDNISDKSRFVISFCCYKGLGLAHNAFDRSNAMLALSGISKFSAKNITHLRLSFFLCL